ncbi:MAG: hypothetical protein V3R87_00595 [Dehalococcoidia bacterium]
MKRNLLIGLAMAILATAIAVPVLALGGEDGEGPPADQESWEAMYEACEDGDWETMAEAAEEAHGEYFGDMPCHGYGNDDSGQDAQASPGDWGRMGDHMDGGMMHGGSSGMMDVW